jgi:hypothetical protein
MVEGEMTVGFVLSHPFDKKRRMDGAPAPGKQLNDQPPQFEETIGRSVQSNRSLHLPNQARG